MTSCETEGFVPVRSAPDVTVTDMCVPAFGSIYDAAFTSPEFALPLYPQETTRCGLATLICQTSSIAVAVDPSAITRDCDQDELAFIPVDADGDGIFERCRLAASVWDIPPTWNVYGGSMSVVARHQIDCRFGSQWVSPEEAADLTTRCTYSIAPGGSDCDIASSATEVDRDESANLVQISVTQLLCAITITPGGDPTVVGS